ncbi:MAG TPA: hypothetical protein VMM92_05320, partial [Thermoanaerobaculia bacterium]|nr:hypothetical protein [Thermoanaerobaculia bacterium]
ARALERNYQTLSKEEAKVKKREFECLVKALSEIVHSVDPGAEKIPYWESLARNAEQILSESHYIPAHLSSVRQSDRLALQVQIYSALAILWAVHKRVSDSRRAEGLTTKTENLLNYIEELLPERYDDEWHRALAAELGESQERP